MIGLPMHADLDEAVQQRIVAAVRDSVRAARVAATALPRIAVWNKA